MTGKIEVKLCSNRKYDSFLEKHAQDHLFRFPDDPDTIIHNFLCDLPSYQVYEDTSIHVLAEQIWQDEKLIESSMGSYIFQKADGSQVIRELYCYQFGQEVLDGDRKVRELHYGRSLTFVYQENHYSPNAQESFIKLSLARNPNPRTRTYLDFVTDSLPSSDFNHSLKGLIIPCLDNRKSFGRVLRTNYYRLIQATGSAMKLKFLEKPNTNQDQSFLEHWDSDLLYPGQFDIYRFLGYCSYMPYNQKEIDSIMGKAIEVQEFPSLLLYRNIDEGHILLNIDQSLIRFFEHVLRTVWKVNSTIKTEVRELKSSIESKIELVELPPFQSAPGSQARKQEALAMARETKKQELEGKISPQNVYQEVDRIFQTEGKELVSFDYFKQKFLHWYEFFRQKRPTGLV